MTARRDRWDMIDQRDIELSAEPIDNHDPIDSTECAEPTDPTDRNEPTDPIDRKDPTDPIESIDPFEPIDRTERSDHSDHRDEPVRASIEPVSRICISGWSVTERRSSSTLRPSPE